MKLIALWLTKSANFRRLVQFLLLFDRFISRGVGLVCVWFWLVGDCFAYTFTFPVYEMAERELKDVRSFLKTERSTVTYFQLGSSFFFYLEFVSSRKNDTIKIGYTAEKVAEKNAVQTFFDDRRRNFSEKINGKAEHHRSF